MVELALPTPLENKDSDVRKIAIAALASIGLEALQQAQQHLINLLDDEYAKVHEQALDSLVQIGTKALKMALFGDKTVH